jgi:hypothetical protein
MKNLNKLAVCGLFKYDCGILGVGNQNFILALQLRVQYLAQSRDSTPDEEPLLLFLVALQLGDRADDAMKASLFRRIDGDQRIAGANQDVEPGDNSFRLFLRHGYPTFDKLLVQKSQRKPSASIDGNERRAAKQCVAPLTL